MLMRYFFLAIKTVLVFLFTAMAYLIIFYGF